MGAEQSIQQAGSLVERSTSDSGPGVKKSCPVDHRTQQAATGTLPSLTINYGGIRLGYGIIH